MVRTCRRVGRLRSSMDHEHVRQLARTPPGGTPVEDAKTPSANLRDVIAAGVHAYFEEYLLNAL